MSIIEKYEKILQKPQPEPFKGYLEELLAALKEKGEKKASKKVSGPPDFKGDFYTPENSDA